MCFILVMDCKCCSCFVCDVVLTYHCEKGYDLFVLLQKRTPLEVSMLQFFYAYLQRGISVHNDEHDTAPLRDTWPSLLALFKEGQQITLPAQGQFMLLA